MLHPASLIIETVRAAPSLVVCGLQAQSDHLTAFPRFLLALNLSTLPPFLPALHPHPCQWVVQVAVNSSILNMEIPAWRKILR